MDVKNSTQGPDIYTSVKLAEDVFLPVLFIFVSLTQALGEPKLLLAPLTKCKLNYASFPWVPSVHETRRILCSIYIAGKKLMSIFKFLVWSLNWLCDKELCGACHTPFVAL